MYINTALHIRVARGRGTKGIKEAHPVHIPLQSNWRVKTATHVRISEEDRMKGGKNKNGCKEGINCTEG